MARRPPRTAGIGGIEFASLRFYEFNVKKHILPHLGHIKLIKLTVKDVRDMMK